MNLPQPGALILAAFLLSGLPLAAQDFISPPTLLWKDKPPRMVENAPPENINDKGHVEKVSIPSLTVYPGAKEKSTGLALIICPGGGYSILDWPNHVKSLALYMQPRGITVIALKYRTSPPNTITPDNRDIPLLDAQRAVRVARFHAKEWNIDPHKIGVVGYSAGANLAVTLDSRFDGGDPKATDPIDRISCRPDFVVGCSVWHWSKKESPFTFQKDSPPLFLVHAADDKGAPIDLPCAIKKQLEALGVPVYLDQYEKGGHGVAHLVPARVAQGYPPTQWPEHLLAWLATLHPPIR